MKKLLIIPFMIMLVIPFSYAISLSFPSWECDNIILEEHFDYFDDIEQHGWEFDEAQSDKFNKTLESDGIFQTYSYGVNQSSTSSGLHIKYDLNTNISEGKIILRFNLSDNIGDSDKNAVKFYMRTDHLAGATYNYESNSFLLKVGEANGNISTVFYNFAGDKCGLRNDRRYSQPFFAVMTVEIDLDNNLFSVYFNDTAIGYNLIENDCVNRDFNVPHISSILLSFETTNGVYSKRYIDDIIICEAIPTLETECDFPSLFCDDFNYERPMAIRNWLIQLGGGIINNSFTPKNEKLTLDNIQNIMPYHETEPFETSYRPDSSSRFTRHIYSPIFSSQFYVNITNQSDGGFKYAAYQTQNIPAYIIKAEVDTVGNSSGNVNWFYANDTQPSVIWIKICGNCTSTGEKTFIKINSLFAHRDRFPFNSSIEDDEIHLYADYVLIGIVEDYTDTRTTYLSQYEFIKESDYNYTVDDYYVMVGTDINTQTFEQYYEDYFIDIDIINETIDIGVGDGDMASFINNIWYDFGLRSPASRIMTGMFLMFLLAIIMFGASISIGLQASAIVIIIAELFFMILLTYIGLLPRWLPFVIILIAAGIGALVIKISSV